jgi:hypothetical protein
MIPAFALALVSGAQDSKAVRLSIDDREIISMAYRHFAAGGTDKPHYLAATYHQERGSFRKELDQLTQHFKGQADGHMTRADISSSSNKKEFDEALTNFEACTRAQHLTNDEVETVQPTIPIDRICWDKDIVFDPVDTSKFIVDGKLVKEKEKELNAWMRTEAATLAPSPPCYSANREFATLHYNFRQPFQRHANGQDILLERKSGTWQTVAIYDWMYL